MKVESAIKESLDKDVVLFVSPSEKYDDILEKIISLHLKKKDKLGIVSLNKNYDDISKDLNKKGINTDKILFIDCVSKKKSEEEKDNVLYVSSPTAYTEINIMAKEAFKAGVQIVVFDSLSKLLIHGNHSVVYKYIQDLVNFVRDNHKKVFFMLLEDDYDKKIAGQIQEIVDKVVNLGKKPLLAKAEPSLAKEDAVKLMHKLFGPQASKMVENQTFNKKPELLLQEFKGILSKLVGPQNAEKQLKELYAKYA